jgi:tripartite-type tricarboxylate transporter receptor subunit TctC
MKKILLALVLTLCHLAAVANTTHTPIKIVVAYAPGGPLSNLAYLLQKSLSAKLDVPVIVEHRPGAGGAVGTAWALNQSSEHILLINTPAIVINTFKNPPPYNDNQLIPAILLGRSPLILVKSKKFPAENFNDLKKFKGKTSITYGSAGMGSAVQLAMEKLNSNLKLNLIHVPYKGTGPYLTDLIAGHIDLAFVFASPAVINHINNGDIVALAVENNIRLPNIKHIPIFQEYGISNVGNFSWFGLFVAGQWNQTDLQNVKQVLVNNMQDHKLSTPYREFGLIWNNKEIVPPLDWVNQQKQNIAPLIKMISLE